MLSSNLSHSLSPNFRNILVVIKQTAFEEYSQLKLRGLAPKALRWERLENRYKAHQNCVNNLLDILQNHGVEISCVNRVELDRQHLANKDLIVAVGGDGTVLSAAHFLDHGTIPLLGINSDPISEEDRDTKKKTDERRSHGELCMCTANNMSDGIARVLHGGASFTQRTRIQCVVKSTFSETRLVPVLNDLLIANPSPAAVSRFRMGWMVPVANETSDTHENNITLHEHNIHNNTSLAERSSSQYSRYGTVTRFGGIPYDIQNSLNVWSSGLWVSTPTGSTAAMAAAGGVSMDTNSNDLQYLIREHMVEKDSRGQVYQKDASDNGFIKKDDQLHLRWNSQKGRIFIDGSHLIHKLELGDEILINSKAPPLKIFTRCDEDDI